MPNWTFVMLDIEQSSHICNIEKKIRWNIEIEWTFVATRKYKLKNVWFEWILHTMFTLFILSLAHISARCGCGERTYTRKSWCLIQKIFVFRDWTYAKLENFRRNWKKFDWTLEDTLELIEYLLLALFEISWAKLAALYTMSTGSLAHIIWVWVRRKDLH